jgi:hypothetical protein
MLAQAVFPSIAYMHPVSLYVGRNSNPNVQVGSDSHRIKVLVNGHPWNRCKGWFLGCVFRVMRDHSRMVHGLTRLGQHLVGLMTFRGWAAWNGALLVFIFIHAGHPFSSNGCGGSGAHAHVQPADKPVVLCAQDGLFPPLLRIIGY